MTINNSTNNEKENNMKSLIDLKNCSLAHLWERVRVRAATHGYMPPTKAKFAFTLAEVLITIGIIGAVAAMTIPTLMTNIRARQYITKYKKALATLSNAARMSDSKYGFDFGGINGYCNENSATDNPEEKQSLCALLNGTLQGATFYYGMDKLANYEPKLTSTISSMTGANKNRIPIYQLQDGTLIFFSSWIGMTTCSKENISNNNTKGCYGYIDVNGTSLPNKEIRCSNNKNDNNAMQAGNCIVNPKDVGDIFYFTMYDGVALPMSSQSWAAWDSLK